MAKSIYNCEDCDREDEFDDMVSCDDCFKWWHFICAGVDERIKDKPWKCLLCKGNKSYEFFSLLRKTLVSGFFVFVFH